MIFIEIYHIYIIKRETHSVFALSDLEDLELLLARARGDLAGDLVVDALHVGERAAVLPVGPERGHELPPVDLAVAVVEHVGHGVHLEPGAGELGLEDALDELAVALEEAVGVLVELAHEVGDPGLLVVVELEEALAPLLPVEVLHVLELVEVAQLVLEPPVPLPRHHPHVPPLVPEGLGARVLDALVHAHAGSAGKEN